MTDLKTDDERNPVPVVIREEHLLVYDVFDLAGGADGEEQAPGEQGVGVEEGGLGVQGRPAAVLPHVRAGEQALKALHGGIHVLREAQGQGEGSGGGLWRGG